MSSSELKKYTTHQILDFVHSQAHDKFVSRSLMKKLKTGVENICLEAFGKDNLKLIKKEVPKIIRASLDARQMGLGNKFLKFLDSRRQKRSDEIYDLFNDILHREKGASSSFQSDLVRHSWADKFRSEIADKPKQRASQ